jgi:hypothetical protein
MTFCRIEPRLTVTGRREADRWYMGEIGHDGRARITITTRAQKMICMIVDLHCSRDCSCDKLKLDYLIASSWC